MSYYHYTSLEALNGILQNNKASKKRLCFWATRYDCFEDKEEYLFGIDCLGKCLSDLEGHYNLQKDRRIAANFKRDLIAGKWMFLSRWKENAIPLLKSNPQIFVQFIGVYMLAFFAPRIKRKEFHKEEETRIILSIPPQEYAHFVYSNLGVLQNMFKNLQSILDVKDIANTIVQEKSRLRANNTTCYYRDFYLPKESLLRIFTLSNESKIQAENILQQKGFNSVKVQRLQLKDNNLCNKE